MKLAVASGKGGTGKTTVSVSLALAAGGPVQLIDCDVEEPNAHIFLDPVLLERRVCALAIPRVTEQKCTYCGKCRDICAFNAITVLGDTVMTFPDICHSCGGCFLVCADDAIEDGRREIGIVEKGHAGNIAFSHGKLRIGEAMATPLIKAVKEDALEDGLVILDSPPGPSCPVVATVRDADYVLVVTEPTPFGFYHLTLAAEVLKKLRLPFGVILNRFDLGDGTIKHWCAREAIPIHMKIPFDRRIAEGYARGEPLIESRPDMRVRFEALLENLKQ